MVLLSLVPQLHLWIMLGRDWNGTYVSPQGDEPLYSAYINALIEGRPRKSDPFGGKDDSSNAPLPESTFSIQFVPAYAIALPARAFGISASTAFIVLVALAAFLASVSVFYLLNDVVKDPQVAAAGTLFVLCLGCIVGRYGLFGTFLDLGVPALPFLRRYQPAVAFPLFFVFQLMVWRALSSTSEARGRLSSLVAGLILGLLVFSYLYLWTAAAAWLVTVSVFWLSLRWSERRKALEVFSSVSGITAFAIIPYVYLLSHRPETMDVHQTMISTHQPDLLRAHEILGAAILFAIALGIRRRMIQKTEPLTIYALSLAFLPFVVFNQQVLTGTMMQSFHFEIFVVNYSTLVSLVITAAIFWSTISRRVLLWVASVSVMWGFLVVAIPARLVFVPKTAVVDRTVPVLRRLKELSSQDGTTSELKTVGEAPRTLVFSPNLSLIEMLPTWTSHGTLLDPGGVDFSSVTREWRKQFFYMHLYYSNADPEILRKVLNGLDSNPAMDRYARSVIFGHERMTPALGLHFDAIRQDEIDREVRAYQAYAASFSRSDALKRPIGYAVVPVEGDVDLANLDRWYDRHSGERVGEHTLYRLKLRD